MDFNKEQDTWKVKDLFEQVQKLTICSFIKPNPVPPEVCNVIQKYPGRKLQRPSLDDTLISPGILEKKISWLYGPCSGGEISSVSHFTCPGRYKQQFENSFCLDSFGQPGNDFFVL